MYHKIILREKTPDQSRINGYGHAKRYDNTDIDCYASLVEKNLPESDLMGKQTWIQHYIFTIRFREVTTSNVIVYKENEYNIISVDNTTYGRNRYTIIKTKRVI